MLQFLHTADIQIGMTAPGVGPLAHKVQEARIESLERLIAIGNERNADFIVIAGDLFESNRISRNLIMRASDILRSASQPVLIIAGNHDYYGSSSVYRRAEFQSAGSHVHVFAERKPVVFPDLDVTIYPCPCFETRSPESPVAWIRKQSGTTYHVCIAHGNIPDRISGSDHDYPMRDEELQGLGMDYTALGHWHSVYPDPALRPDSPYFYSGTPEPTRFGENSGYALWVELDNGSRRISALPTSRYQLKELQYEIHGTESLAAIRRDMETHANKDTLLVKLVLTGVVPVEVREQLDRLTADLARMVAFMVVRDEALALAPTSDELARFSAGGVSARLLSRLRQQHDNAPDSERAHYARAMSLVYTMMREYA